MVKACEGALDVRDRLLERNRIFEEFFAQQARPLAVACREMSGRFLRGGRLLAFGRGPYATDAQHVSVEFVHPIIVGKRALPALDLSLLVSSRGWRRFSAPEDMVMGFGPPEGDAEVAEALAAAHQRGAMTFELPGRRRFLPVDASGAESVRPSGVDGNSVSHVMGNRTRLLRAPGAGPRRRRLGIPVSISRRRETAGGRACGGSRRSRSGSRRGRMPGCGRKWRGRNPSRSSTPRGPSTSV